MWLLLLHAAQADDKPAGSLPSIPDLPKRVVRVDEEGPHPWRVGTEVDLPTPVCTALHILASHWQDCLVPADELVVTITTSADGIIEAVTDGAPRTACLAATLEGLPVGEVGQGQTRCWMSLTQQGGHVDPAM